MRVKMLASFSGGRELAIGDEHDFEQAEAERLIEAGFAVAADKPARERSSKPAKKD